METTHIITFSLITTLKKKMGIYVQGGSMALGVIKVSRNSQRPFIPILIRLT